MLFAVQLAGQGLIICSEKAIRQSDEFLTSPKFWLADAGSCKTEAKPRVDSPVLLSFYSHCVGVKLQTQQWRENNEARLVGL